jgi:Nuclear pore complex scaffold, nucleoporins 186/192/205
MCVGVSGPQGPSAESREQVKSGCPVTVSGNVPLNATDIQDILLLSDELRMDELLALQYLLAAHTEVGPSVFGGRLKPLVQPSVTF